MTKDYSVSFHEHKSIQVNQLEKSQGYEGKVYSIDLTYIVDFSLCGIAIPTNKRPEI